jgi:hypothetical protein
MNYKHEIRHTIYKIRKNSAGVTLLELTVCVFLFSITILAATGIFQSVISSQKSAMASQNLQDNIRYAFERMGKDVRSALVDSGHTCNGGSGSYNLYFIDGGGGLNFKNNHNQCVRYYASSTQLYVSYPNSSDQSLKNGLPLTGKEISLTGLVFKITDKVPYKVQGLVTARMNISINVHGAPVEPIIMETTISTRNYQ